MTRQATLPPPEFAPEDVRRAADSIVVRAEYREPQPSLVDRALEAIGDLLGSAIDALTGGGPGSLVGIAILGLLATGAVWLLTRSLAVGPAAGAVSLDGGMAQDTSEPVPPEAWLAEADRLEAGGDRRGALRCRYQAFVAQLRARRSIDIVAGTTPHELSETLATRTPSARDDLHLVTSAFEDAWYGGRDVDVATLQAVSRVLAGLPERTAAIEVTA